MVLGGVLCHPAERSQSHLQDHSHSLAHSNSVSSLHSTSLLSLDSISPLELIYIIMTSIMAIASYFMLTDPFLTMYFPSFSLLLVLGEIVGIGKGCG